MSFSMIRNGRKDTKSVANGSRELTLSVLNLRYLWDMHTEMFSGKMEKSVEQRYELEELGE